MCVCVCVCVCVRARVCVCAFIRDGNQVARTSHRLLCGVIVENNVIIVKENVRPCFCTRYYIISEKMHELPQQEDTTGLGLISPFLHVRISSFILLVIYYFIAIG